MDPLSALSIAAAVVQFLQFGGSLISKASQIHKHGAVLSNISCAEATTRLEDLSSSVKSDLRELEGLGKLSPDSKALEAICANCVLLSKELSSCLAALAASEKLQGKDKKWKSFRQAIKTIYSKDKVDGLAAQLRECREELNTHLIVSIKRKADALGLRQEEAIKSLSTDIQTAIDTILKSRQELQCDLSQRNQHIILSNEENHTKTRASILLALGEAQSLEIRLLQSLRFPAMNDRHIEISEANRKTFRWIFESDRERGGGDYVGWLEKGDGIYWINGKAGSGKSTLMRYIFDHQETRKHLQIWAGDSHLEVSGFFFWNSGSKDQRSQAGLFRSLLYQALHRRPDLVRVIFAEELADNNYALAHTKPLEWAWPLRALHAAFRRWVNFAPDSSKMCFFIDGLDEYEGDHDEIAEYFKKISSELNHVKICISSRPWVVFDDAFKGRPSIRLQDLTSQDIEAYVNDELLGHRRMQALSDANPTEAANLSREVVTKASGVFLWVILVVRSLLRGLRNQDEIEDLKRRLQELPSDLASLYTHMLDHVEPLYNEQASQIFQIFSIMVGCEDTISSVQLEATISAIKKRHQLAGWDVAEDSEIEARCKWLDVRLKTRCAGLIEMSPYDSKYFSRVSYLHRTVKEFLDSEDVRAVMLKATKAEFEPYALIINARITLIRRSLIVTKVDSQANRTNLREGSKRLFVDTTLDYAKKADVCGDVSYLAPLDQFQETAREWWMRKSKDSLECKDDIFNPCESQEFFRAAMKSGLCSYVQRKLKSPLFAEQNLLMSIIKDLYPIAPQMPCEIIDVLLKCGYDPNQVVQGETVWRKALTLVHETNWRRHLDKSWTEPPEQPKPVLEVPEQLRPFLPKPEQERPKPKEEPTKWDSAIALVELGRWAKFFKLMLQYGAKPAATCLKHHRTNWTEAAKPEMSPRFADPLSKNHAVSDVIADVFEIWLPIEGIELRNMLEEQIEAHIGDPKRSQSSGPAPRAAGKTAARKQKPKTKKGRKSGVSQGALRPDVVLVERPKSAFEFRVEGSRRFGFPAQTVDSGFDGGTFSASSVKLREEVESSGL